MNLEALDMEKLGAALVLWLIVALIIEEGVKPVFDWKHFKDNLSGHGLKTPIIFAVALLICWIFKIDIFMALVGAVGITAASNWLSYGVSALLLTGGSGTVFRFMNRIREAKRKRDDGQS